jgi:hypothetical protein
MKRHPALQDLSRDHHLVLIFCQRIRRAVAARAQEEQLFDLVKDFLAFHESDLLAHFQEEDGFIVPLAANLGTKALVAAAKHVEADHVWLRDALTQLRERSHAGLPVLPLLSEIEPRLSGHVRQEESELFEGVQDQVPEEVLKATWAASFAYRSRHRAPSACTVRPPTKLKRT